MKRVVSWIVVLLIIFNLPLYQAAAVEAEIENNEKLNMGTGELKFDFNGDAALLMEVTSGTLIWEMNSHERLYPASITKIMSILIVMEQLENGQVSLNDKVTVSEGASAMGGSELFLSAGDLVSLENLLIGMAVASANDAAVAVAEHIGGSVEGFAKMMNKKACELGMTGTSFRNPHGLHGPDHYTTAHDVAIMSMALLEYPQVHQYATIWMNEHFLKGQIRSGEVFLSNTNRMVRDYEGCDGLKTGFTSEAGNGISATARRGQTRFLAVVLGCPTVEERYKAARTLLDYGFENYKSIPVVKKGQVIDVMPVDKGLPPEVHLTAGERFSLFLERDAAEEYRTDKVIPQLKAPLEKDEKVGELVVFYGESEQVSIPLVVLEPVERTGRRQLFLRLAERWLYFGL